MKLFTLIEQLKSIYEKYGDLECVIPERISDRDEEPYAYAGYVSMSGETYSQYEFDNFPEDYAEEKEMFGKEDLVCVL